MLMYKPAGSRIEEELIAAIGAGATRYGPIIDTLDWGGAELPDYSDDRAFGWPLLDLAVQPPANANILIEFATNSTPAAAPTLVWSAFSTIAVVGGSWGVVSGFRIPARFARYGIQDTSAAPQNNVYVVSFVRAQ